MLRLCLFLGCLPLTVMLFAQEPALFPEREPEWRGAPINDERIKVFRADAMIEGFDVDTLGQIIYLTLRDGTIEKPKNKGKLVAYDLETERVLWQQKMNSKFDRFILHGNIPLFVDGNNSYALEKLTGRIDWFSQVVFEFCVPDKMICMGMQGRSGKTLAGVDLNTGEPAWEYSGSRLDNLESVTLAGDSGMVISSLGIHYIDFSSGRGFSHEAEGELVDDGAFFVTAILFGAVGAVLLDAATRGGLSRYSDRVGNQKSNVVVRDGIIYFATLAEVIAVDYRGNVYWRFDLPGNMFSMPKLFMHDEMLYVMYSGLPVGEARDVHSEIYFSKINPQTGRLQVEVFPGSRLTEYLTDFLIRDSTIVLAKTNGVSEYSLDDLTIVSENSFGDPRFGAGLDKIVSPPYFVMDDGKLDNRSETRPDGFYIENRAGMKIEFTPEFEMSAVVRKPQFFQFKQYSHGLTILENGSDAVVLNEAFEVLDAPKFTDNAQLIGDRFYDFSEDKLMVVPVSALAD